MTTKRNKKVPRIAAADLVPNDGTQFFINGNITTIIDVTPGPVWLNPEHTHLVCPEDWLCVTTAENFRIAALPETTFIKFVAA